MRTPIVLACFGEALSVLPEDMGMNNLGLGDFSGDEGKVAAISQCQAALQMAIHEAVEAGLKVTVVVESMQKVGDHYSEPLVEVDVERVIKLT